MRYLSKSALARLPLPVHVLLLLLAILPGLNRAEDERAAVEQRLADSARYLASDELEGRGIGTRGLDLAAEYIAGRFAQYGLKTELFDGTPYQTFQATTTAKPGENNRLAFVGPPLEPGGDPQRIELRQGEDFTPMAMSGSGHVDLGLVFAGYGITAKKENYDDYAGLDVAQKAVVILRHEPQQANPNSVFNGTNHSEHAPFVRKLSNAFEHKAAAVIFSNDQFEIRRTVAETHKRWQAALDELAGEHAEFKKLESPSLDEIERERKRMEELIQQVNVWDDKLEAAADPILPFQAGGGESQPRDFPVVFCRRALLDRIASSALGTSLTALEEQIDQGPAPQSRPLEGWRAVGDVEVQREKAEVKNVAAVLEGEGPLAEETLIVGAHYDHLGWGGPGSMLPDEKAIHNGADDNASGVAVLLEVARTLALRQEKLRRRVVFLAFTGEERGLLGSGHYVAHPLFPVENTVAMLNMDMVGRLRDDKLIVAGSSTAGRFAELLDEVNPSHGFQLSKTPSGFGPSDHTAFYARKIPVLHFFTGSHSEYHRPGDDFQTLNVVGMRRVASLVTEIVVAIANAEKRPEYVSVAPERGPAGGERPYFGSIPDFTHSGPGYAISGVTEGGPAQRAGLLAG
ncbi:MAG: hypothetical protein A2V98_18895, partial [Planctomycetes bacterium RBG_16_64_12]